MYRYGCAALILVAACSRREAPTPPPSPSPAPQSSAQPSPAGAASGITWIHDDYAAALARARATKKPIFLDAWAQWCHTCLSMQRYVFTDPGLSSVADRFVWLAIDTEKPVNAPVVAKFPPEVWPTFFLIDPDDESLAGRWPGSASVDQLRAFLDDGERAVQQAHASALPPGDPLAHLLEADRAAAARSYLDAAALYEKAIAAAPADWPRRPDAIVGRMVALWRADKSACVDFALSEAMDQTGRSASASDFASYALMCADELPKDDPRASRVRERVVARLRPLLDDASAPLSADDRGDAYGWLIDAHEQLGDPAAAKKAAEDRLALLEKAVAAAPDPDTASTFDMALSDTYVKLGRGDEAVKLLVNREKELPTDYNAAYWLSRVYLQLDRPEEALSAVDRSLAKVTPVRRSRLLAHKARVLDKLGRRADALAVADELVAHLRSLPPALVRPGQLEDAEKQRAALASPAR